MRIVEELNNAGARVVTLQAPDGLAAAGVADAQAVICADDDDALNLEIALLARQANPDVRVVARLANSVLREAMAQDNGPGAILDVADLAAPSVVEACLARTTHTISVAGIDFVVSGHGRAARRDVARDLRRSGTGRGDPRRELGQPRRGGGLSRPRLPRPRGRLDRDDRHRRRAGRPGHRRSPGRCRHTRARRPPLRRVIDAVRAFRDDINPMFYRALAASLTLLIGSTVLLRFTYQHPPGMSWIDALYFQHRDHRHRRLRRLQLHRPADVAADLFGIGLMFAGVTTTAILVAFIADLLLSRRMAQSAGRRKVRHLRDHVIVVGLGSFGIRVVSDLMAAGYDVAVIERNDDNRYLSTAARLDVPVIFGDATLRQTLESARIDEARAVAVLTQDDMVNIETGIVLHEMLGPRMPADQPDVPIVLRVYDRTLGAAVAPALRLRKRPLHSRIWPRRGSSAPRWGCRCSAHSRWASARSWSAASTSHRAASWTACGWSDLSTQTRVIAITRPGSPRAAASAARHQAERRRHRLPGRSLPRTAGHPAQRAAARPARPVSATPARRADAKASTAVAYGTFATARARR